MMKRILLALALLVCLQTAPVAVAPAYAVELNSDTGCDSSGAWMLGTGWTVSGSKCVGTSVSTMKMLMQMNTAIKAGHRYRVTFTLSNYTAGQVRASVGVSMPAVVAGSWVTAASTSSVADNFTTASGLTADTVTYSIVGPGNSSEVGGAFRFACNSSGFGWVDPLVSPGQQSKHLHEVYGNSGVVNSSNGKSWTFNDFRTKGSSTCGDNRDPTHPINRTGYWIPGMLDGMGNILRTSQVQVYYKGPSNPAVMTSGTVTGSVSGTTLTVTAASANILAHGEMINGTGITTDTSITAQLTGTPGGVGTYSLDKSMTASSTTITVTSPYRGGPLSDITGHCAQFSPTNNCVNIPTGLRMVTGFDSATGLCGPTDTTHACGAASLFDCFNNSGGGQTASYTSLEALRAAGVCPSPGNGQVRYSIGFPNCWDATNVDSPNHRDHMAIPTSGVLCPSDHAAVIPTITIMAFYPIDAAFVAGTWRLTSDEMATSCAGGAVVAGCTLHADYFEAWSPTIRAAWFNNCIWAHNSCSNGQLADGTQLKDGAGVNWDGTNTICNGCALARPDRYVPTTKFGMSKDYTANGTYTVDMTAPDNGVFAFMGLNGFSGSLDNISVTEISTGAKGPVTVHN